MKHSILLALVAASLILGSAWAAWAKDTNPCADDSAYPLITKSELKKLAGNKDVRKKDVTIYDVNSPESFQKAHVPGAIAYVGHEKEFMQSLPKDKGAMIVAYCGGVKCEAWKKAAEEACNHGYTNIHHFKEGISGWVKND